MTTFLQFRQNYLQKARLVVDIRTLCTSLLASFKTEPGQKTKNYLNEYAISLILSRFYSRILRFEGGNSLKIYPIFNISTLVSQNPDVIVKS